MYPPHCLHGNKALTQQAASVHNNCLIKPVLTHREPRHIPKRQAAKVKTRMVSDIQIIKAFVATASVHSKLRHGKWIPATYWAPKVSLKLPTRIKAQKLVKVLEKLHVTNRKFTQDEVIDVGILVNVDATERRIIRSDSSKPSRVSFICVNTKISGQETLPVNHSELARFFQARYDQYQSRKSILLLPQTPQKSKATPSAPLKENKTIPTIHEESNNRLYEDGNRDLLALLEIIIRPEYLQKCDLLKDGDLEAMIESFRLEVQSVGCRFQTQENERFYKILARDRYDDNIQSSNKQKYEPFLTKFCCPWSRRAIQGFLTTAIKIAEDDDSSILQLPKFGGIGYGQRLVPVVPGDTPRKLYKNAKGWMPRLYEAINGNCSSMSRYDICYWLIKLHRYYEPKAFQDACRTSLVPSFKMDVHRQIAMFQANNLTYEHGRGMRPYLNADKCNPFHSESVIRKLEVQPGVEPKFTTFLENKTQRQAWCLPAKAVVTTEIQKNNKHAEEIHVLLAADHGQGAFRVNVSAIQVKARKVCAEASILIGHVDCRKDTMAVLNDSKVLSEVNSSLVELKRSDSRVCLMATGDLAWFSTALGKPAMAGEHCWRCKSRWKDFQDDPLYVAEPWALDEMKATYEKLNDGTLNRKDKDQERGLVDEPLVDCVEPVNWLFPPLHGLDLLTNAPYKYLQRWVWNRLEDVPLSLIEARDTRTEAAIELERLWDVVIDCEEDKLIMEEELRLIHPNEAAPFNDEAHEQEWLTQKVAVTQATSDLATAKADHDTGNKHYKKLNAVVNKLEKQKVYGRQTQDLWMKVERLLRKDFNVYPSTYHGGDLEGNECRRLLRHAAPAMNSVSQLLIEQVSSLPADQQNSRADCAEIKLFTSAFKRLFQYMDILSHYCYQPMASLLDDDLRDAERCIVLAAKLWRNLMPTIPMKVHAWQHLREDLQRFRGLKSHTDHGIERAHQAGQRHAKRLACIRDFEKKTLNILRQDATARAPEVIAMKEDTEAKKRKRKIDTSKRREQEDLRTDYIRLVVNLPEFDTDLPTLIQLAKQSAHQEAD